MKYGGNTNKAIKPKLLALSVAACFSLSAPELGAQTLPTGVTPVAGVSNWNATAGVLTINTIGNSVLRYNSFSIGAGATVQINQQSAVFASLQRVVGSGGVIPQSVIDGLLQSNGRVFLLNPSGVVIGAGGRIDVAGFVASSLNLSDDDFLKGRMRFGENPGAKAVQNFGTIQTASGGNVYLIAPQVENHGIISAPQGQILLAAGKSAELVSDASPYVTVKVVADSEKALNVGQLIADSGKIGIFGALVQNSGIVEANGATRGPGGEIRFVATKDLTLDATSRVSANGTSGGKIVLQAEGGTNLIDGKVEATGSSGKGGEIQALGVRVGVVGHGIIDASGETGGGTVLVGGDYQGKNPDVQNAERTFIGTDGVIRADAGANGDGGRVIVWADGDTRFYGSISAKGGTESGNGGFVETSGKGSLQAFGSVVTSAPHGKNGNWLLDPADLDVVAGYGADDAYITIYGPGVFDATEQPGLHSQVGASTIEGYGTDVTLQATNDINFFTDINKTNGGLFVHADRNINLNSSVITTSGGQSFVAGASVAGGSITSTATGMQLIAGGDVILDTSPTTAGSITVGGISATSVNIASNAGINTGSITAVSDNAQVALTAYGGSISTGPITTDTLIQDSTNRVTLLALNGSINVNGDISTAAGFITLTAAGAGNITTGSLRANGKYASQSGGPIAVNVTDGVIMVNGDIESIGAAGAPGNQGGFGSTISLNRFGTADPASGANAIQVTGVIRSNGGAGGPYGFGGGGGSIIIGQSYGFIHGNVSIGGAESIGGAGGAVSDPTPFSAGGGGSGGSVLIYAYGAVSVGSINASGGPGGAAMGAIGNRGGDGGEGGFISVYGGSIASSFMVAASGAGGFSESGSGGSGGFLAGEIDLRSPGPITVGVLDASGGLGGAAPNGFGGAGGNAGFISVIGGPTTIGQASTRGGAGGDGVEGGFGGVGRNIFGGNSLEIFSTSIVAGIIDVSGGNAGASTGGSFGTSGGSGGSFQIGNIVSGNPITDSVNVGFIIGRGGNGSNTSVEGGFGGDGGSGTIKAVTSIILGPKPQVAQSQTVVDLSGGVGGGGGTTGGDGGFGGTLNLDPVNMTINGVLVALGGAPGAGATSGIGGDGGSLTFATTGGLGTITFVNGGWDLTAGAGGTDGSISGAGTIPAQLAVARFVFTGPGTLADIPVDGVGIFRFTALSDPLTIPFVLQVVGAPQQQGQQVAEGTVEGNSGDKEDKDKQKTGSLGSCRPS